MHGEESKPWAGLIVALLLCASAQAAAEACETERQTVLSASKENKDRNLGRYSEEDVSTLAVSNHVAQEVRGGGDFRFVAECGQRCIPFEHGAKADSPNYRDALLVWADLQDTRVTQKVGRGPLDFAFYRLRGCIAREMAAKLKPSRPHQPPRP
jgi:hypothetical protein